MARSLTHRHLHTGDYCRDESRYTSNTEGALASVTQLPHSSTPRPMCDPSYRSGYGVTVWSEEALRVPQGTYDSIFILHLFTLCKQSNQFFRNNNPVFRVISLLPCTFNPLSHLASPVVNICCQRGRAQDYLRQALVYEGISESS